MNTLVLAVSLCLSGMPEAFAAEAPPSPGPTRPVLRERHDLPSSPGMMREDRDSTQQNIESLEEYIRAMAELPSPTEDQVLKLRQAFMSLEIEREALSDIPPTSPLDAAPPFLNARYARGGRAASVQNYLSTRENISGIERYLHAHDGLPMTPKDAANLEDYWTQLGEEYKALHKAQEALGGQGLDIRISDPLPPLMRARAGLDAVKEVPSELETSIFSARENVFDLRRHVLKLEGAGKTEQTDRGLAGAKRMLQAERAVLGDLIGYRNKAALDEKKRIDRQRQQEKLNRLPPVLKI